MDLTIGIVLTVIGLVIGFLLSALINSMRSGTAETESAETKSAGTPASPDLVEAARIWRDRRSGQLVIEVDNKLYKIVGELNPVLRDRLGIVANDLHTWLGSSPQEQGRPAGPAPVQERPSEFIREQTGPEYELHVEPSRPSVNPLSLFARAIQEMDKPKVDMSPASIAAQIDEILQEKLEDSPLEGRSIRLMELPGQGMVVMVGLDKYEDVDTIPDRDVRQLIHAAVAEWERASIPDRER